MAMKSLSGRFDSERINQDRDAFRQLVHHVLRHGRRDSHVYRFLTSDDAVADSTSRGSAVDAAQAAETLRFSLDESVVAVS